jgi:hypothetical protein
VHVLKRYGVLVCASRVLLLGLGLTGGCDAVSFWLDAQRGRSALDLAGLDLDNAPTHFGSDQNKDFLSADIVSVGVEPVVIRGSLAHSGDVSVYDLGPVNPGDRVLVEVVESGSGAALALFDDTGGTLLVNDHRNVYLSRRGPFIDIVIRRASRSCYVAFTSTPGFSANGPYTLVASVRTGEPLPSLRPDTVLLVFSGGQNVRIGSRSAVNVPVFDAGNILPQYNEMTEEMTALIVDMVREDFAGLDVVIYSTSEGAVYDGTMTRLYFGAFDAALLGVAEGVDEYNLTQRQQAIVFTDTFKAFERLNPTITQMSQAIANVASHEIGHLLGLVHTSDPSGIMDVTASLSELTRNQAFAFSPIYSGVFPIGSQDGVQLLLDSVGGDPGTAFSKSLQTLSKTAGLPRDGQPPARSELLLGTCQCGDEH